MIMNAFDEAVAAGVTREAAAAEVGAHARTLERWRTTPGQGDRRCGPKHKPMNTLSEAERARVLAIANSPEFRDCSPKQIVPRLADRGTYVASESSMYRILREEKQLAHRESSRPAVPRPIPCHTATGPDQVYSWDITYLPLAVRGTFCFLYLFLDIWSRKIVGYGVEDEQDAERAAAIFRRSCEENDLDPEGIVLHSDNGGPMKGTTMLQMLEDLGVMPSFSRPSVSDDNAYSEALFRTVKFRPGYPVRFDSIEHARRWVHAFVQWYNFSHRHSGIRYVTAAQRHAGDDIEILRNRKQVYERARKRRPARWTRGTRCWKRIEVVRLNSREEAV